MTHTREVPGARGLPLLGETPSFLYDVKRFIDERAARYGATFRTHLFGTPTVLTCSYHTAAAVLSPPPTDLADDATADAAVSADAAAPSLDAAAAYAPFLRALYPAPNLLLSADHEPPRAAQLPLVRAALRDLSLFGARASALLRPVLRSYSQRAREAHTRSVSMALYATFKPLAWRAINEALLGELDAVRHAQVREWCAHHFNGVAAVPLSVSAFGSRSARAAALSAYHQLHAMLTQLVQHHLRVQQQPEARASAVQVLAAMVRRGEAQLHDAVQVLLMLLTPAVAKAVAGTATIAVALLADPRHMALQHDVAAELQRGRLHTLDCVLMETLRMYPPLAGAMRAATADTVVTALRVPRGSSVWLSYMHANRDERAFERAQQFEPARWSAAHAGDDNGGGDGDGDGDGSGAAQRSACPFARARGDDDDDDGDDGDASPPPALSFGGGRRACGGRDVAWALLRALVGDVLRELRVSGARVRDEHMRYVPVLRPRHDALVRVCARREA